MRRSLQLIATGFTLAAVSACSDLTSARLMAPDDASATRISDSKSGTVSRTYISQGGVTATTYEGNTSGEGNSSCSALNLGSTGTKVDGAYSRTVAGYVFTVSGSEKQFLAFAPVAGTTPPTSILAVIVKGGPAYNVYRYTAGQTSDAGLTSPVNGGGNIPTISHYVVCYGPRPVTPPPVFTKKLVGVMKEGATIGSMLPDLTWPAHPDLVVIPIGSTRWLEWELSYTLPAGVTGTITENATTVCGSLGTFVLQCSFNENPATYPIYKWSGLSGTGTVPVMTDLGGGGGGSCGDHEFTNTATITLSNGTTLTASKTITVRVVCQTPVTFTKKLVGVMKEGSTVGSMVDDPTWPAHPDLVIIPWGKTRWLDWQLSYTLPAGVTGVITENANTVCGSLGTFVLQCTFNENPATYPIYSWSGLSGQGAVMVMNDLGGGGGGSCGDHDYTNTATLTLSNGTTLTASKTITVRVVCPTP